MNILILGASGFLGCNLVEELVDVRDFNIITFDLRFSKDFIKINRNISKTYLGNFNDENELRKVFENNDIHLVIHLISTTIPSTSNINIPKDINSNLLSTIKLLEIMRENNVSKIIFLSSGGTVYGIPEKIPVNEEASTNPICSYGVVKLAIEKYILLYNYLYGFEYLILRVANLYGEYHYSSELGLINVILSKLIKNENIKIWGDGSIIRDYIYVKDLAGIIRLLVEQNTWNQVLNICTGKGRSINEILDFLTKKIKPCNVEHFPSRKFDIPNLVLSNKKLMAIIDFKFTPFETGVIRTYNWTRKNN